MTGGHRSRVNTMPHAACRLCVSERGLFRRGLVRGAEVVDGFVEELVDLAIELEQAVQFDAAFTFSVSAGTTLTIGAK